MKTQVLNFLVRVWNVAGLDQEGIFRISGNLRTIDRLKVMFDRKGGEAYLSEDEDIMAIAGLLKLFLRELPDSLIPQTVVKQLNSLQDSQYSVSVSVCIYWVVNFCRIFS